VVQQCQHGSKTGRALPKTGLKTKTAKDASTVIWERRSIPCRGPGQRRFYSLHHDGVCGAQWSIFKIPLLVLNDDPPPGCKTAERQQRVRSGSGLLGLLAPATTGERRTPLLTACEGIRYQAVPAKLLA
jgi:hypothetical protein